MPTIIVRGRKVDVDVRAELEKHSWERTRWEHDKLIANSPFRYERSPSFFVRLEPFGDIPAGTWSDSGAYDSDWGSGGLVKLLAFLRSEDEESVQDYLLSEYPVEGDWQYGERLEMPGLALKRPSDRRISLPSLDGFKFRHPYLERRGISDRVQRLMGVGYCKQSKAVTIPWFDEKGRLANIKYRKADVGSKIFWYTKGAVPIRQLVYGLNVVNERKIQEAVICEAEIDAMSFWEEGIAAVAVGGASFSDYQAEIIRRSTIKKVLICSDNDKTGEKLKRQIVEKLRGYVEMAEVILPANFKDANEIHVNKGKLSELLDGIKAIRQITI